MFMAFETLGDRIAHVRGGLTQQEFAERLGISRNTLVRYENNKRIPDAEFLCMLARNFGADPQWLLMGGEPPMELSPRESALIANYRASPEEAKRSVETTAALFAQPKMDVDKAG
jgi:transcriptional regulator with XRE-family HTH domain